MIGVYFSGTGNTKYCVEQFLSQYGENAKAYAIEEDGVREAIRNSRQIVLAYPIYYSNLPKIVRDFLLENRRSFAGKKVFLIATMGLFSGDGTGSAARVLKRYGVTIIGGLHVKMPDCVGDEKALKKSVEENRRIVKSAEQKIREAVHNIKEGNPPQEGLSLWSHIAGLFGQRLWFYGKTKDYTDKLTIDASKCIHCGKCAINCPMDNIKMEHGMPNAQGRCTMCYRCVSNCPGQAITILGDKVYEQVKIEKYL